MQQTSLAHEKLATCREQGAIASWRTAQIGNEHRRTAHRVLAGV